MVSQQADDEALMAAYQAGDPRAFEVLFGRYRDRVYGYFCRVFGDVEVAADLAQSTFFRVHRARKDYDRSRSFATWVFGIAANLGKDEWKRRARRPGDVEWQALESHSEAHAPDNPEQTLLAGETAMTVEAALAALPAGQREVIVLHKLEGLSFPEIAAVLGENVEALKSRAFRGYRELRRLLSGERPEDSQ